MKPMKLLQLMMGGAAIVLLNAACGGGNNPYGPWGPYGPNGGIGQCAASLPPGVRPDADETDIDRTYTIIKEPEWLSGGTYGPFNPIVVSQGTLELHTRKIIGSSQDVGIFGCFNVDHRAFFTNFFWSDPFGLGGGAGAPLVDQIVPMYFSHITPTGQPQIGRLTAPYADQQTKVLEAYGFTAQIPIVGQQPNFGQFGYPGIPQQSRFILRFSQTVYPTHAPTFVGSTVTREGDFEVYYGSGLTNVFPGGLPQGAPPGGQPSYRSLWFIRR